jgi:tetratricopeptide (TPR) repeat protein
MRLAVVVASSYPKSTSVARLPVAEVDGRRMAERLGGDDARFVVEEIPPDRRLGSELESVVDQISAARGESTLFFYFSGYAALGDSGELELELDARRGPRLAVSSLRASFEKLDQAVVMLDLVHAPDEYDPTISTAYVAAARDALAPKESGIGLLVAARPSDRSAHVPSPLTHLLLRALERLAPSAGGRRAEAITLPTAYESMREDRELFHELPAAGCFRGRRDLALLVPPSVVVADAASRSEPPPRSSVRPSAAPVSLPPTPAGSTAEGDELAAKGDHEGAIDAYKRALLLSGSTKNPERALLYHRIGRAKRALGSTSEAVHNFDKALAIDPLHEAAFRAARELCVAERDFQRLEKLHRRRLEVSKEPDRRVAELRAIAELWQDDAKDDRHALPAIEQWIELRPDLEAHERLVGAFDRIGRPAAAVSARKRLAELSDDPVRRGQLLTDAARISESSLPNKGEAIELARQALEADAGALAALEIAATLLGKQRRWRDLAELYGAVLERTRDDPVAWDIAKKLGVLARDQLDDATLAKRAFSRALNHDPGDVELRYWLSELLQAEGDPAGAAAEMRRAARDAPRDPDVFRRALWLFEKSGEADAAWCAAAALDQLGEADINESLLADAHRPEGLPAVRSGLDPEDWSIGRLHPERDRELDQLFATIAEAAVALGAERLARSKRLPTLDPSTRQDVEKGTATVARSLLWTARLLAVELPALHVVPEVSGGMLTLPSAEPSVLVSRSLSSGVELPELAFLWGRQLWFHRREHLLVLAYPTLAELAGLLLAALAVSGHDSEAMDDEVQALAGELESRLDEPALAELRERASAMRTRGLRRRVVDWTRAVHLCAARAGLLATGDLARAADVIRRHPPTGGVEPEAQIDDLRAYSISREHAELRARIGVALRG